MLNIVQHGDHFELRIDNQSFQHLYHMERTKEAFVYEGEPSLPPPLREEEPPAGSREDSSSYGYGNYKKGQAVPDWQKQTAAWSHNQRERQLESSEINDLWKPTEDVRRKRYDDGYDDAPEQKQSNQPKAFDFDAFSLELDPNVVVKKAQYVTGPKAVLESKAESNLIDFGPAPTIEEKKFNDLFSFEEKKAGDFDLLSLQPGVASNPPPYIPNLQGNSDFNFDFGSASQTQPDLLSLSSNPPVQQASFDFDFDTPAVPKQTQAKLEDLLSFQPTITQTWIP